jgi:hypothetical protein
MLAHADRARMRGEPLGTEELAAEGADPAVGLDAASPGGKNGGHAGN